MTLDGSRNIRVKCCRCAQGHFVKARINRAVWAQVAFEDHQTFHCKCLGNKFLMGPQGVHKTALMGTGFYTADGQVPPVGAFIGCKSQRHQGVSDRLLEGFEHVCLTCHTHPEDSGLSYVRENTHPPGREIEYGGVCSRTGQHPGNSIDIRRVDIAQKAQGQMQVHRFHPANVQTLGCKRMLKSANIVLATLRQFDCDECPLLRFH